ncbi:hypothetical protein C8F04DRAFT_1263212 [Mycena alexandri]|uniref:Uncharacterized protein n=1 Tax=Mycena alexandri TaxID=1745969 RepID=A0AAD6SSY7_9AGAR|nr:hypothetical protein C8F04DRAFT_1263212 [Mycena alexandri]
MALESTGECTAHDKHSEQECDCSAYTDATDIPGYCGDCYHRRQDHLVSRPGAVEKTSAVRSLLAGLAARNSKASSSKAGSSKAHTLFSHGSAATTSKKRNSSDLLAAANREANRGMRSSTTEEGKSKKGKGKEPSSKRDRSGDTFKVVSLQFFVPNRVLQSRRISGDKQSPKVLQVPEQYRAVPDRIETQSAELDGLAIVKTQGIKFDREADHEEIVAAFTKHLPLPFAYFDRIQREADNDEPVWYLASALKKQLVIVPSDRPDGSVVDFNKGNATTGFRNNRIFIVSRAPIPADLLQEWAKTTPSSFRQSLAADTSEEESGSDVVMSDESGDDDSDQPSPEKIPRKNKPSAKWTREPEILNDNTAHEIMGSSELIDLTSDEVRTSASTPDFLRATPRSPPIREAPPSPGRPDDFDDTGLGNPYDKDMKFIF